MPTRSFDKPAVALCAAVLALVSLLLFAGAGRTAEGEEEIMIGTYDPRQVAQAVGFQQQVMEGMQGLQERAQQAREAGDQQAMQQIQAEAQQVQQGLADEFLADIEAAMPEVAAGTGVRAIATDVTYTAPGIGTRDVTQAVIDALGAGEAAPEPSADDPDQPGQPGDPGS